MVSFLDIGAVRVQRYVGRWPKLAGRRAASAMLVRELSFPAVEPTVAGRGRPNMEDGDVDSVLSLILDDGVEPAALARDLLVALREALPSAEFEASWAVADEYLSAFPLMRAQAKGGGGLLSLPLECGFPG